MDYDYLESIYLDVTTDIAEYVQLVTERKGKEFLICHYILNADYNIVCVIPKEIAHQNIIDQIEDVIN